MKQQRRYIDHYVIAVCFLIASCNDAPKHEENNTNINVAYTASAVPAIISYNIVNIYPHDAAAFTEGLEYKDGYLYEGTGQYKHSDVRKVDLKTGKVVIQQKMQAQYFGEGITLLGGKLYQLTYREGKGFIYDAATLKAEGTFHFDANEGWGMTNNGTYLIYDDGGNVFHYLDPKTFKEVKRLAVTDEHGPVMELNEPELIHGYIYANQWRTDYILKIDTTTGHVIGRADLSSLRQDIGVAPASSNPNGPDVMNGIAYDAATNRIFITGKNWPKLVEIKLEN